MQSIVSSFLTLCAMLGLGQGAPAINLHSATPQTRQVTINHSPSPSPSPARSASPAPAATAEIASEQTCPGQSNVSNTVSALTCLTNNARKYRGLKPVTDNQALLASAAAKNHDMATCGHGHTACGRAFDYWIKAKGYAGRCYGENIAMGQKSPHDVFLAWMNSPGHRANILNAQYRDFGVAETAVSQGPLWVMELGGC